MTPENPWHRITQSGGGSFGMILRTSRSCSGSAQCRRRADGRTEETHHPQATHPLPLWEESAVPTLASSANSEHRLESTRIFRWRRLCPNKSMTSNSETELSLHHHWLSGSVGLPSLVKPMQASKLLICIAILLFTEGETKLKKLASSGCTCWRIVYIAPSSQHKALLFKCHLCFYPVLFLSPTFFKPICALDLSPAQCKPCFLLLCLARDWPWNAGKMLAYLAIPLYNSHD